MNLFRNPKRSFLPAAVLVAVLFIAMGCEPPPSPDLESPGGKLYIEKCSTCHPPRHPRTHNYKRWVKVVGQMEKKVKISGVRELLTEEEKGIILAYLKRYSKME